VAPSPLADPNHDLKMNDFQSRQNELAALLLKNRNGGEDWGEISHLDGQRPSKQLANKFLACCLLDYQQKAEKAWDNGYRLVNEILHNPEDLWGAITSVSRDEWNAKKREYNLHWKIQGHERLWRIGKQMLAEYQGDARLIWEGQKAGMVLERLWELRAGDQISRMIVGALKDCGLITGASDVKADVYVRRVLGLALEGQEVGLGNAQHAVDLARELYPADPWQLDWALWHFGQTYCHPTSPNCSECPLAPCCAYAAEK
jgi:hypothetical protein